MRTTKALLEDNWWLEMIKGAGKVVRKVDSLVGKGRDMEQGCSTCSEKAWVDRASSLLPAHAILLDEVEPRPPVLAVFFASLHIGQ